MSNELMVSQPSALTPVDNPGRLALAEMMCEVGIVPERYFDKKTGKWKVGEVAMVLLAGKELGYGPSQSINDLYAVHGQIGMMTKLMGSRLLRRGHRFSIDISTNDRAVVTVTRRDGASFTQEITLEFARQQGWPGRNENYAKIPAVMLRYRALSWAIRAIAPDALDGLLTVDEIVDGVDNDHAEAIRVIEGEMREAPAVNELRDLEAPTGVGQPWMGEGGDYDKWTLKPAERELFAKFREEYGLSDVDAKRLAGQALDVAPLAYFRDFPGDRLRLQAAILYELDSEVEDAAAKLEATEGETK